MDCLEQARTLYGEYHRQGNALSQDKQVSISTAITKLIRTSLLQQGGSASFRFLPFTHVIQRTVGANRFQGDRAAAAFLVLEKYLLLFAQQPWKREFWVLKMYGGYFCTKVKAHLEGTEEILKILGFMPDEGDAISQRLVLHEAPDSQVALSVAFDCQVASLECQYIGEYYSKVKFVGLDLLDAMNVLLSGAPNDLLVGSSLPGEVGRNSVLGNLKVNYNPSSIQMDELSTGRGVGPVKPHTVLASGGMGMGVVTGAKSMHQVIGVQPSHGSTHHVIGVSVNRLAGAGPHATTGATSGVNTPESLHSSSSVSSSVSRGPGAGHSVVRVTGVPATPPPDPSNRKLTSSAPIQPPSQPPHLSAPSPSPSTSTHLPPQTEPLYVSHPVDTRQSVEGQAMLLTHPQSAPLAGDVSSRPSLMTSHPPSVAYQSPGSRGSFASSAYGYGSGSASVLSGGSSACTASSGYCSAISSSSSSSHEYANLPIKPPSDCHDSSPSRLHRQSQKPQVPFIEEDEMELGVPFPEATHEEHLRESLRNLQVGQPDKTKKRPLSKNVSSQFVSRQPDQVMGGGADTSGVAFDDWRWFRGETEKGLPSPSKVGGDGGGAKLLPVSGDGQLSANLRPKSSQPAMVLADTVVTHLDRPHHPAVAQDNWKATVTPNPVYYPPPMCEDVCYDNTSMVTGPPPHHHPNASFPQKVASTTRWKERSPQSPRSWTNPSPSPIYNNLDRSPPGKVVNLVQDSPGPMDVVKPHDIPPNIGRGVVGSSVGSASLYANVTDMSGSGVGPSPYTVDGMMGHWTCSTCTMVNVARDQECRACGRGRGAPEPPFSSVAGESRRVCPSCTFENPPGCRSCEVCEILLPQDVHTYV